MSPYSPATLFVVKYHAAEFYTLPLPCTGRRVGVGEGRVSYACQMVSRGGPKVLLSRGFPTARHVVQIVPALQKRELVGLLAAEEIPAVARVIRHQILLPDVVRKNQVCRYVVPFHVDRVPVTVGKWAVVKGTKQRPPNTNAEPLEARKRENQFAERGTDLMIWHLFFSSLVAAAPMWNSMRFLPLRSVWSANKMLGPVF